MYRLTAVLPCWGRPERTKRIIEDVLAQKDADRWELILAGDGCPVFQELIDSGFVFTAREKAYEKGNRIHIFNLEKNYGGHGYQIMNIAIAHAKGRYFIWLANDDHILPNHFSNYLEIEKYPELDYMYFNSYIEPTKSSRISQLGYCQIGHSEIIVKTDFARTLAPHKAHYGHDWDFINEMIQKGKGRKADSQLETYRVMHVPNFGTVDTID